MTPVYALHGGMEAAGWLAVAAVVFVAVLCLVMAFRSASKLDSRNTYTSISGRRRRRESVDGSGFWADRL